MLRTGCCCKWSGSGSVNRTVVKLDGTNGDEIWARSFPTGSPANPYFPYYDKCYSSCYQVTYDSYSNCVWGSFADGVYSDLISFYKSGSERLRITDSFFSGMYSQPAYNPQQFFILTSSGKIVAVAGDTYTGSPYGSNAKIKTYNGDGTLSLSSSALADYSPLSSLTAGGRFPSIFRSGSGWLLQADNSGTFGYTPNCFPKVVDAASGATLHTYAPDSHAGYDWLVNGTRGGSFFVMRGGYKYSSSDLSYIGPLYAGSGSGGRARYQCRYAGPGCIIMRGATTSTAAYDYFVDLDSSDSIQIYSPPTTLVYSSAIYYKDGSVCYYLGRDYANSNKVTLFQFNYSGSLNWSKVYYPNEIHGNSITVDDDSNIYVC